LPYEKIQSIVILPYRNDGSIYSGVLTYIATKPVEVIIGYRVSMNDGVNISAMEKEKFGHLMLRNLTTLPGNMSIPMHILPNYGGTSPPYFSASIPFVDGSVTIRRSNGDPFAAAYEVSANIIHPEIARYFENTAAVTNTNASYGFQY
jgi:hypothetical protein